MDLRRVILEFAGNHGSLLQAFLFERKYSANAPQQDKRSRLRVAETRACYSTGFQRRQFEPPAGALCKRLHILHRVQVGDEAGVGGLVHVHEFGLALDQVAAAQVRAAGENLRVRHLVEQDGVAPLAIHHRHDDMARRALLERADQLGQIARADQRLVGGHDEYRIEGVR